MSNLRPVKVNLSKPDLICEALPFLTIFHFYIEIPQWCHLSQLPFNFYESSIEQKCSSVFSGCD